MPRRNLRIFMWVADTTEPYESMPEEALDRLARLDRALSICARSLSREKQNGDDGLGIFLAPEWLFRTMEPYTEGEKNTVFERIRDLSNAYRNLIIVPGSLTWHKLIDGKFAWVNSSIVAWDGEAHYYNKRHDHDSFVGYQGCYPYFEASRSLFDRLRLQYDPDHERRIPPYLKSFRDFASKYRNGIPYETFSKMIKDGRLDRRMLDDEHRVSNPKLFKPALLKWEYRENRRTMTFEESGSRGLDTWRATPGEKRLLFSEYSTPSFFQMKYLSFCIETCADYGHATAAREYVQEYPAGMGVDLHFVIANGVAVANSAEALAVKSMARPGGLFMICNAKDRRMGSCVVSIQLRHKTIEECFLGADIDNDPWNYVNATMRVPGERDIVPGFTHQTNVDSPATRFRDWIYDYRGLFSLEIQA